MKESVSLKKCQQELIGLKCKKKKQLKRWNKISKNSGFIRYNIHLIRIPEEERENKIEELFEAMTEFFKIDR